ncbi:jasmonoyl--L-amino acid synthetase JAR4-like [Tasmannia lanceolata]|uniref:jasmonoyl--L-amino acid synthetase JAR4-like n=1 Tax=Tasmannia lanceolata TaxID=3420 RepID=UPI00406475EF
MSAFLNDRNSTVKVLKMSGKIEKFNQESVIEEFESITKEAGRVQRETLRKILEENSNAEYLQRLGLKGRTDLESFKACVPLVTHKDLEPYIHRIADGETKPILTGKSITTISLSSGTTQGKPKFVPFNEELVKSTMQIFQTSYAFRNREFPIENGKALQFIYSSKQFKTKGGLTANTATTNVYRSKEFKNTMKDIQSQCCSPDEVIFGPDFNQSLYCHLLCGLIYWDKVQFISSTFSHSIVHAFRTFELIWEELCTDIRDGVLTSRVAVPSIRAAISKLLKPNPELADSIYKKCLGLSNWYGVIPELWPNAKYVYGIMTGSMEPYLKKLRHYAGNLPLLSADYGSSEGWIGANVNPQLPPESATFAVLPDIAYFEFIPIREKLEEQELVKSLSTIVYTESEPVSLTEVKVGEEYEIIITNFAGLYRYRLGDIVKVMGFHNSTPELQFIRRRNLLLTINIDKNTEKDLQLAVEAASKPLADEKLEVVDFTSHVDLSTDPGHYVIFWELSGDATDETLSGCSNCLDQSFLDAGYVGSRKVKAIGALELRVLRRGTFQKILDHYVGQGAAVSQFKTPRCVGASHCVVLQILCSNVVKSYFSTAFGCT